MRIDDAHRAAVRPARDPVGDPAGPSYLRLRPRGSLTSCQLVAERLASTTLIGPGLGTTCSSCQPVRSSSSRYWPTVRSRAPSNINSISTSLILARCGVAGVYSFIKFGVNGFTESLRQEVTQRHVRVGVVEPGGVRPSWARTTSPRSQRNDRPLLQAHRGPRPRDIADGVAYMVTRPTTEPASGVHNSCPQSSTCSPPWPSSNATSSVSGPQPGWPRPAPAAVTGPAVGDDAP
jgi:NAD(P)-dependent dehydrogenase (short-subunit alcohol dehydrogenase family)